MTMPDSQRYPKKICLIKYQKDININNFDENWLFLIVVSPQKLVFYTAGKQISIIRNKHL